MKQAILFSTLLVCSIRMIAQCDTALIYSTTSANAVCYDTIGQVLKCYSNNYPDHNDTYSSSFTLVAQDLEFYVCLYPDTAEHFTPMYEETETSVGCTYNYHFGVGLNGVKYSPNSDEYFVDSSGANNIDWHIEARFIFNPSFGNNGGHLNPFGQYHYHDIPLQYYQDSLGIDGLSHSPIVGYAADGFPMYYKYVYSDPLDASSGIAGLSSGYSLKSGTRPGDGFSAPDGSYTGLYYEDYEYAIDSLDSCNGRFGVTPDFPNGTYYYVLTDNYPYVPRCFKGSFPDHSFRSGPGVSCPTSTASTNCDTVSNFALVSGCMDPFSCNYNPSATVDDGSCFYAQLLDTTIATSCNQYMWHGMMFSASGTFFDTINSSGGCDSIATLILTLNNTTLSNTTISECGSYFWQGNTYMMSGVYMDTLMNSAGCDSILTLQLTISDTTFVADTAAACGSYTWQGMAYTSSGTYGDTIPNGSGCDSILSLLLTINSTSSSSETVAACDSYTWAANSNTYSIGGTYTATLTNAAGCDSTATLNLTINSSNTGSETVASCSSYTWAANSVTYATSGAYTATLTNAAGCDSVATLNLTVSGGDSTAQSATACDSYDWNGTTYTSSGVYSVTNTNGGGCDSVDVLTLTVNNSNSGSESVSTCSTYVWAANNTTYIMSGTYSTTLTNMDGCDSVATLSLSINSATTGFESVSICNSYLWPTNNVTYSSSGTYTSTFTNSVGCDSTATLNLTILASDSTSQTLSACNSYTWNGTIYSSSGTYTVTHTNTSGCDSVDVLNLTINTGSSSTETVNACGSYLWAANNTTYSTSGTYSATLTNTSGCDSIATLILSVSTTSSGSETVTACDSYVWPATNITYSTSGTYTATLMNSQGCDSTVTLNLTINNSTTTTETVTACDSYTWTANNVTYTIGGLYNVPLTNSVGCDSIALLVLTITNSSAGSMAMTACDSFFWPPSGITYTTSGSYTDTILNSAGCDSVLTLNLTINNGGTGSQSVTVCNVYMWPPSGQTYTASGTYTATLPGTNGCDSTAILNLTVNTTTFDTFMVTACGSYTWNGSVYGMSGSFDHITTNSAGCDSVTTLLLTIVAGSNQTISITSCEPYLWNGVLLNQSGVYPDTFINTVGCDSIVTLDLLIETIDVSVTVNDPVMTANESGAEYQWLKCEPYEVLPQANQQNFTALGPGLYAVEITKSGCTDTSDCYEIEPNGIESPNADAQVSVFPNPNDGSFTLQSEHGNYIGYDIYNALGERVNSGNMNTKNTNVVMNNPKAGVYIIRMYSNSHVKTRRFVIQ